MKLIQCTNFGYNRSKIQTEEKLQQTINDETYDEKNNPIQFHHI